MTAWFGCRLAPVTSGGLLKERRLECGLQVASELSRASLDPVHLLDSAHQQSIRRHVLVGDL